MMRSRARTALGALALCALALSAFAAATAVASGGLTAVECVKAGAGHRFESSHCLTNGKEGEYETVAIKPGVKKEVEGTLTRSITETEHGLGSTANPVAVFHSSTSGIAITTTCGTGNVTGAKLTNEEKGEMQIHVVEAVLTLTECHAALEAKPTTTCTLQGTAPAGALGEVKTNKMTAITGSEHKMSVKPETGSVFTEFKINASGGECFTKTAMPVKVTGEVTGTVNTTTHSHLTIQEPWPCGAEGQPACGGFRANGGVTTATETVAGFTKGNKEATVGATTESEIKETEA